MKIKTILAGTAVVISFFFCLGLEAVAVEYPTKPINVFISYPPGTASDLAGRALATSAGKYLGVPFVVENKSGGGGTLGPQMVSARPPDGYTIGNMLGSTFIAYHMGKLTFNPMTDLTYITPYFEMLQGIVVRADSPWKTMKDLIEYSRKNPGKVSYGSSGVGTTAHIPIESLAIAAGGIKWTHIPYDGSVALGPALLGGHVDFITGASSGWMGLILSGQFKLLATYGNLRSSRLTDVPTLKELGYDVVMHGSVLMVGPKGMPKPIVQKLYDALRKAQDDPAYLNILKNIDMEPRRMTPEETEKMARQDFEYYGTILEKLGLKKK